MRRLLSLLIFGSVLLLGGAACMAVVISVGLGVGICLNWLVPSIDLAMATTIGILTLLIVLHVAIQIVRGLFHAHITAEPSGDEAPEDDGMSDQEVDEVAGRVSEAILENLQWSRGNRRRRSRAPRRSS